MLSRIRRWLNVKTWDPTHIPSEPKVKVEDPVDSVGHELERDRLREELLTRPGVPQETRDLYLELDRLIRIGEADATEAMSLFTQFGFTGDYKMPIKLPDGDVWEIRQVREALKKDSPEPVRCEEPPLLIEEYVFPPQPVTEDGRYLSKVPVHVVPRSALLVPVKLTPEEREVASMASKLEKFFDSGDLKLKPAIAKKITASNAKPHRVYWDDKGKMKKVKETAA